MVQIYSGNTKNIFYNKDCITNTDLKFNDEYEIPEIVANTDLSNIFQKVANFNPTTDFKDDCQIETFNGTENAVVKIWVNKEEKIEFWKTVSDCETGWGVVYCNKGELIMVGNYFCSPFGMTQDFHFEHSDGWCTDDYNCNDITLKDAKTILTEKFVEYTIEREY